MKMSKIVFSMIVSTMLVTSVAQADSFRALEEAHLKGKLQQAQWADQARLREETKQSLEKIKQSTHENLVKVYGPEAKRFWNRVETMFLDGVSMGDLVKASKVELEKLSPESRYVHEYMLYKKTFASNSVDRFLSSYVSWAHHDGALAVSVPALIYGALRFFTTISWDMDKPKVLKAGMIEAGICLGVFAAITTIRAIHKTSNRIDADTLRAELDKEIKSNLDATLELLARKQFLSQ